MKTINRHLILLQILIVTFLFWTVISFSQESRITKISFLGVKKTSENFLEKMMESKKGGLLDSVFLKEDIVRFKRLPAIANADYKIKYHKDNYCTVIINIEENFTLIPEINLFTTTNKKLAYKIGFKEYNLFGKNITFGGFYQNNGFDSYGVNFRAPTLFSNKWGLSLNHQKWVSEEPLYFDDKTANYKYENISHELLGLHQLNFKNQLQFGLSYFTEKYEYLTGSTDPSIPLKLDVDKWLFKTIYTYDNLNYYYQYIDGFKNQLYGQYVISENEFQKDFLIFWNDFFYYKRLSEKGNWANRLRVGFSSNIKSPFAPFALDNNVNLRGVGILVDRGTGSVVLNSEYRHTLYDNKWLVIQSNVFIDAGTWRNPGGDLDDFIKEENVKVYSGIGLRFINKKIFNAVFRIDYGVGLTKDSSKGIVFGIGQYF